MPQEVMLYHSGMQGAPSATVVALGGLTAVLDACLVDGFNVNAISTLTRSGAVATATTSGTNGYAVGDWVDVSGATQAEYNGRVKVTGKPAVNQFTYDVTGSPATPATGTITSKYGAAGWTRPFAGTNTAVYTSGAGSLGHSMQVEDNNPFADANVSMRTRIVVGASGIPDAGTELGEQCRLAKANGGWVVVADHRTCYAITGASLMFGFGEFASYLTGDTYAVFQNRGFNTSANYFPYNAGSTVATNTANAGIWFPAYSAAADQASASMPITMIRAHSQLAGATPGAPVPHSLPAFATQQGALAQCLERSQGLAYPNGPDNALPILPEIFFERLGTNSHLRGRFRGLYCPLGQAPAVSFTNNVLVLDDVVIGGAVRKIALVRCGRASTWQAAFDLGATWG